MVKENQFLVTIPADWKVGELAMELGFRSRQDLMRELLRQYIKDHERHKSTLT